MNVLVLFLIGMPLVLGVFLRFKDFNHDHFKTTLLLTVGVFACVGVGYAFRIQSKPPLFFARHYPMVGAISIGLVLCILSLWLFRNVKTEKEDEAVLHVTICFGLPLIITLFAYFGLTELGLGKFGNIVLGATIVVIFCVAGALNAILGPIAAGFTLTAFLHALIIGEGFNNIYIWKEFFEFFNINGVSMKIIVLLVTGLLSSYDTMRDLIE